MMAVWRIGEGRSWSFMHGAWTDGPDACVVVPSYGNCRPGYVTLARSLEEGGYEPTDSF
jgi:hypothetical protein